MGKNYSLRMTLSKAIRVGIMNFEANCVQLLNDPNNKRGFKVKVGSEEDVIAEAHEILWGNQDNNGIITDIARAQNYGEASGICDNSDYSHDDKGAGKLVFSFISACSVGLYEHEKNQKQQTVVAPSKEPAHE